MRFAITWHVEGPPARPSGELYEEIARQVILADELGFNYAWFAEHHGHAHLGHLPCPLLLALHLAARTRRIHLGTAVICLNMHDALNIAEQIAVADHLAGGRIAPGFGSGSTPQELALYGRPEVDDATRHLQFEQAMTKISDAWKGAPPTLHSIGRAAIAPLPVARPDLASRTWVAANSTAAAAIAGRAGHNVMFSYLQPPERYVAFTAAYTEAGGRGLVAANRAVYVGADDDHSVWHEAQPMLRILWRRFQREGKLAAGAKEPAVFDAGNVPAQFVVGNAGTVARQISELHQRAPFDVFNIEPRWDGLTEAQVHASIRRFAAGVVPQVAGPSAASSR